MDNEKLWVRPLLVAIILSALIGGWPFSSIAAELGSTKDGWDCACDIPGGGRIQRIVDSYPVGGPEFTERLTEIIVLDPNSARDLICAVNDKGEKIRALAAEALAMAQLRIARNNPTWGDQIAIWISCADASFQSAYYTAQLTGKLTHLLVPYIPDDPGAGVVSPSRP